jgi:hypothetical protein
VFLELDEVELRTFRAGMTRRRVWWRRVCQGGHSAPQRSNQNMHSLATFRVAVDVIVSACRAQFNLDLSVLT